MSGTPLKLEDPAALKDELREALQPHRAVFESTEFIDVIVRSPQIALIAEALGCHLARQRIHGYHCTREPESGYFAAHGLRPTTLDEHHEEFLARFGRCFSEEEVAELRRSWGDYFTGIQRSGREGKVCFCLSRALVFSDGARPFFEACGGEAIYMPLPKGSPLRRKLGRLGRPVVVEAALPGDALVTHWPMALTVLSRYHRAINPRARLIESEAYIRTGVAPEEVLRVIPIGEFES